MACSMWQDVCFLTLSSEHALKRGSERDTRAGERGLKQTGQGNRPVCFLLKMAGRWVIRGYVGGCPDGAHITGLSFLVK